MRTSRLSRTATTVSTATHIVFGMRANRPASCGARRSPTGAASGGRAWSSPATWSYPTNDGQEAWDGGIMRVLEVSRLGLFKGLLPAETEWIRGGSSLTADEPVHPEEPSVSLLASTLSRIRGREFDLIVLPAIHPEHVHNQSKIKLMSKTMLRNAAKVSPVAPLVHRFGLRSTNCVVLDIHDERC